MSHSIKRWGSMADFLNILHVSSQTPAMNGPEEIRAPIWSE